MRREIVPLAGENAPRPGRSDARPVALAVVTAASVLALLAYAGVGSYVRYVADDFCTAASVRAVGWLGAQGPAYAGWSGRFAATGLTTALEVPGPWVTAWVGAVTIALVAGSAYLALRATGLAVGIAVSGTAIAMFALVTSVPQPFESFYWLTGATTYAPSLILMALAVVAARRKWVVLVAALGFLSAGFSETAAVVQFAVAVTLLVLAPAFRPAVRGLIVGTVIGALIVIAAPGNEIRAAQYPSPNLLFAGATSFLASIRVVGLLVANAPAVVALVFSIPLLFAASSVAGSDPGARRRFHRATLLAIVVVAASVFPAVWATSDFPPDRALIFADAAILGWLAVLGWAIGSGLRERWTLPRSVASAAVAVLALVPLISAGVAFHGGEFASWAASVDTLSNQASIGEVVRWSPVAVPLPLSMQLGYPGADPGDWRNGCMASYLGLPEVTVLPK